MIDKLREVARLAKNLRYGSAEFSNDETRQFCIAAANLPFDALAGELESKALEVERQINLRHATAADALKNLERAEAAEAERDALRKLLGEAREMADNWPGIAYSADLTARIDAAMGRE